ncbi:hypothetical protein ACQW02_10480 [Humitalea sp. 24SJ18S-53]|uniref:hypothetical protein n=1 Tax=Humitalea sp. 24SJ18S-53 TaxID=3422307 RepID=UPI003D677297
MDMATMLEPLALLLAGLLALGMVRLGALQYGLVAPHDAEAVPLLHVLAAGTGLAGGIALLLSMPDLTAFLPTRIFTNDSPWSVTLGGILGGYALPRLVTLRSLVAALGGDGGLAQVAAGWIAVAGLLAGAVLATRLWHGRDRVRAIAAFVLLAVWTALILHYAAHLAVWMMTQLNFWLFAVALVLFQHWRYRAPSSGH